MIKIIVKKNHLLKVKFIIILILFWFQYLVYSKEYSRAFNVGVSYQYLLKNELTNISQHGTGIYTSYEFLLKPTFVLGINASYRYFFTSNDSSNYLTQLGYGLLLKHYIFYEEQSMWQPYLQYGLLLNVSMLSDKKSSATSHDTRLCVGSDINFSSMKFFMEIAYHYSRVKYFDLDSINVDNFDFILGLRLLW